MSLLFQIGRKLNTSSVSFASVLFTRDYAKTVLNSPEEFQTFISSHKKVVIDCHAEWCGPCKVLGPILEEKCVAHDVPLGTIDVDAVPELSDQLNISSLPTVMAFKEGNESSQFIGNQPEPKIEEFLKNI